MKRAEQVAIGIFIVAVLFKVMHWPMGGMLMVLSMSLVSILYFPLAVLWFGVPERRDQVTWLSVAGGYALSMQLMGILFTFQHWPMAQQGHGGRCSHDCVHCHPVCEKNKEITI